MTIRNLVDLLEPASVAVFGASNRAGSIGAEAWRQLRAGGFQGAIHAVNPKHATLDGEPVFARAADLPAAPALALLCTPADTIAALIGELGALGIRAAIVMTADLSAEQTQAALDAARPHLLRLLGPASIGLLTPRLGLNASAAHPGALPGELAFVSQSGALVAAMLDWAAARRIGFSQVVALGESADVDFGDLLDHLASDGRTRAILLHVEAIKAPRKFMSAARAAARNKPVIIVKAGRADPLNRSTLAGSDIVFDAAIRRAGMLRVDTLQDLFVAAETLARFRTNRSDTLTIVCNGSGAGLMAADAALLERVPLHGEAIDLGPNAAVEHYVQTLSGLLADPAAGALLFIHAPTAQVESADIARACAPLLAAAPNRVLGCWLGDAAVAAARQVFKDAGVPDYATPEEAVRAFAMLATYRRNQEALLETPSESGNVTPDVAAARALIEHVLTEGRETLSETESNALLRAYGVPVLPAGATPPQGHELIVGAGIDPLFGPALLFGHGGGAFEVVADRAVALPPLNRALAAELVARTRVARLLAGYAEHAPARLEALYDVLIAVSQMLADLPQLSELKINPLLADAHGVIALDARVRVSADAAAGASHFAIRPYPAHLAETLAWQGRSLLLRPIRPEDESRHRAFLQQIAAEDLRMRIFGSRRELPHNELARLTQIDYAREMAFVAVDEDGAGGSQTLGVVRASTDPDNQDAEFGLLVRSDLKGQGLGRALLAKMIRYARGRGTRRLVAYVLRENTGMRELARSLGFVIDATQPQDSDAVYMVLPLGAVEPADAAQDEASA